MVQPSVQNAILAIDTNEMIELVDIILFQMRKNELVVTLRVIQNLRDDQSGRRPGPTRERANRHERTAAMRPGAPN